MATTDDDIELIRKRFKKLEWAFDERMRRLFTAAEAAALGWGGVSLVSKATGMSRRAIHVGLKELVAAKAPVEGQPKRVRKEGAGRKCVTEADPDLIKALENLVEPTTRGDPESTLRWTCKSLRTLAGELTAQGRQVSYPVVGELLRDLGYSLQANRKVLEGGNHPDRNAQFEFINEQTKSRLLAGNPVISVDTKKKELVGAFKNNGATWLPKGKPESVKVHDFVDKELGRANPYGVYDVGDNTGWVSVGTDHDTAGFAVETIRRWWNTMGRQRYPRASELMITADGGGSNGSRLRLWKMELQRLTNEICISVRVCHLPPGTSKWNKIEHRLFSYISMNWRGQPLVSHEVIVKLIAGTTTRKGLKVHAELDDSPYPPGIKISDAEFDRIRITRDEFHGEWNYRIDPNSG